MLSNRALLVRLHISQWYNQTTDSEVTQDVATRYAIDNTEDRYVKRLIPMSALSKVRRAITELRNFHNTNTLPWQDDSTRILSTANFFTYQEGLTVRREAFEREVRQFITSFPAWIQHARQTKGALFRESDYPRLSALENKFSVSVSMLPFPDVSDFRVDLEASQLEFVQRQAQQTIEQSIASATQHAIATLRDRVELLYTALASPTQIFRDATFQSVIDTTELISRLNIANNQQLNLAIDAVRNALSGLHPELLRTNPHVRQQCAANLYSIINALKE